ncbi:putative inactive tRNA-specific adenosine deaminase-like protein 3 isoform X6 [Cucumis melo var. makuwa]|uniref:Putative inactive tRNA-specific adenosine deaminase-like protein 3 isoform X6 n=1 Tax=Cucumis melo var. makuwa TaxID=1194695 RepID=A0A5D3E4R1_CUCMM|nr:putative inactive tRNA-specific adenosine deaminase-like protein 3 isoform X6 [Cucumis melo var. makuwa]
MSKIIYIPDKLPTPPDQQPTVNVFAAVVEPKIINNLVRRLNQIAPLENLRHVKRVQKKHLEDGKTQIALILCVASENNCDLDVLSPCVQELVTSYKLSAFITKVCKEAATTKEEWEEQCKLWPTSYHPPTYNIDGITGFNEVDTQSIFGFMRLAIELAQSSSKSVVNAAVIVDPSVTQVIASACDHHISFENASTSNVNGETSFEKSPKSLCSHFGSNGSIIHGTFPSSSSLEKLKQSCADVSCLYPLRWVDQPLPHSSNSCCWHPLRHAAIAAIESSAARDRRLFPTLETTGDKSVEMEHMGPLTKLAKRQKIDLDNVTQIPKLVAQCSASTLLLATTPASCSSNLQGCHTQRRHRPIQWANPRRRSQPSGHKSLHAPLLSGACAHAPPSVNLTAHPIRIYASSPVQPSHPSGHPLPHASPIAVGKPSKLSNLYSSANLYSSTNLSVDPLQQPFFYRNGTDQHHNRSGIETDESSAPSGYGQPCVHGLGINQTYRRAVFEVSTFLAQIDLPIAQSLTHDNGKPILVCEYCKKQGHTKDQCRKLHRRSPRGNKHFSKEQQNLRRTDVWETASTSQPIGPTTSQTSSHTLSSIAQSADDSLAPIPGKGQIVLYDGFSLQNVLHDLNSGRTIGTARHSRGLYILNDDISGCSISTTSLLSSYFSTFEHDFMLWHFRCTAYVHSFGPNQTKFTPRAPACVFVGYPLTSVGESVSEESNNTFEFIEPTPSIVSDIDPHLIILPTNQVPWKTYYRRNLRKEVGSPTSQTLALVQDFEPPQDQGMENPTESCTNNTISENDRSDAAVLGNMEKKNRGDETEVRIETSNDEAEQGHTRKHDEYDHSLDLSIALRKECPEWKNAVMEEMKALEKNNTWEICALPKGHKPVGCKWVFTLKYKADGTLDRHKARVLFVAVNKDWPPYQLDVKNAFLNGDLVEVYMSPPPGFEAQFTTFVKFRGYSQGHSDHTLFTKVSETGKIAVLIVYVDDIILSGDDQAEIRQLKHQMGNEFEIKDLGNLKYFLGMEVTISKEGISMSQRKYTLDLLTETVLSQIMQAPYEEHMEAIKRIMRYLKTTPSKGLMFRNTDKKIIEAYTDSDWARSVVDRKSTFGYCTFVWGNLVTWRSKKQSVVARSSAEAEYRAMSFGNMRGNLAPEIQHDRTKHVEIDRHFIKERLDSGSICIPYIPSSRQVVDVLTKGLLRPNFDFCVSKLGLIGQVCFLCKTEITSLDRATFISRNMKTCSESLELRKNYVVGNGFRRARKELKEGKGVSLLTHILPMKMTIGKEWFVFWKGDIHGHKALLRRWVETVIASLV